MRFFYRFILFLAWMYCRMCYRHKTVGTHHLSPRGAILASNHSSFLDPILIATSCPQEIGFLARSTLFKPALFGRFLRALNAIPIHRQRHIDSQAWEEIADFLATGKKIVMFPEGKRTVDGSQQPLKRGASAIARHAEVPIIPVYISGAFEAWGRHRFLPKLYGSTCCTFGAPIEWSEFAHLPPKEAEHAMTERVAAAIAELKQAKIERQRH